MNGTVVRLLINDRPHLLTIYALTNLKLQLLPPGQPQNCVQMSFSNAKFDGNFFVKGKTESATVTFYILTLQTFWKELKTI